jgi:hypothetical protein
MTWAWCGRAQILPGPYDPPFGIRGGCECEAIFRQLEGGTRRILPFQQKRDADANENEWPDP